MNALTKNTLAVVAMLLLAVTACKKGDEAVEPADTSPAFVGKNLMMTSFSVNPAIDLDGDGKLDSDLLVFLRPCDRDNTIKFEKNGILTGGNGQLSCDADETDPSTAKASHWTYNAQTKTIRIISDTDATDVSEWKIVNASATDLTVEIAVSEPTRSYKTVMTWKAV